MMRKILPLLLGLIALAGGGAAGYFLRPAAEEDTHEAPEEGHAQEADPALQPEYVRMNNQFIVPILEGGRVASMVVLSLSLEVTPGSSEAVYAREPKIRDAFLQVLFDHANSGGFRGSFTDGQNLVLLRRALAEQARLVLGDAVTDVLITEIARQDS